MVDLQLLEGVFVQVQFRAWGVDEPTTLVKGLDRSLIKEVTPDGDLVIDWSPLEVSGAGKAGVHPSEYVDSVIRKGRWMPIFNRNALSELKSVSVIPKAAQLSSYRFGKKTVPTFMCDRLFAKSIMNWYAKVGDFVSMPGVLAVDSPKERPDTFQSMTVLPAVCFLGEGDAILWNLTAFDVGSDLFAEARTKADQAAIERVNDFLVYHHEYFQ